MSAFEVAVTPPRIKNARKVSASREPTDVVLGLFSAKSIVTFEDIPITKTARRTLHIHNPTDNVLKVLVTKTLNPIANAQLEWTSNEIPARGYLSMDIVWNPTIAWSTREIIQFTDNRNFKKDVAVILKSIDKTQSSKVAIKKTLGIKSHSTEHRVITKKLALKSPSPRSKLQQRNRLSTLAALNGINGHNKKDASMSVKTQSKKVLGTNNQSNGCPTLSMFMSTPQLHEKENYKPQSPPNMSVMLDALNFTPAAKTTKLDTSSVEYLASLPTPNTHLQKNQSVLDFGPADVSHIYRNLNETETLITTPFKLNDQTTILGSFQTPMDRSEVDNSRYFNDINDRNQFAMQKTPAFNDTNTGAPTKRCDMLAMPGRKLNLDDPNVSPLGKINAEMKDNDISFGINRTQTLSSPIGLPKLSIIEEEQSKIELSETYIKQSVSEITYNVMETVTVKVTESETPPNASKNLVRDVQLIATPLSKKYLSMKELTDNNSNLSLEQKILKMNQGSMPNLHKLDKVKSIENNRYFYQSIEKDLQETENAQHNEEDMNENVCDTSICSVQSTVSTQSVAFNEHEILAQSSRLNLNEIGQNKPTKPANLCFTIDKPKKPVKTMNRITSTKYLSASSPSVNKPTFEKPKLSQSIRDISTTSKNRPSVISYASSRSIPNSSVSLKKRGRDDTLDSSKKSLNKVSPPKRVCIEPESPKSTRGQAFRTKTWGGVMPKKFRIPSIPPQRLQLKRPEEERVILYDPELHLRSVINPDPFAATTTFDPFLSATMYLDERAVDKHEIQFKKWLNALVTIPGELDETAIQTADVAKLFHEVQKNKDCTLAPTKETVSSNYLTKYRLASLRSAAIQLILSPEMQVGLSKLTVHVEKKLIQIRQDRNLHLDVVLQRSILELLLKFNPLWLRIGLEVVFGETIPMHNNHDMIALSTFILNRLFRDRYLESKHPKVYAQGDVYADHIKKHTLKKFLSLLYFLDVAKTKKIIKHNPCLFLKSSEFKETKEILLRFSSSLLGNIGDVQRDLRRIGIVLTHKQTFIDEFDYAFRNLAIDLRDGVRLTKVMEIILLRDDLTCQLRVPAISRTQRIHNVGLALKALEQANFDLTGKITPADIADGHREKTLSLLWQIIYRFRAPKFNAAAAVIQNWWRKNWLNVCIRRRIRAKIEKAQNHAATVIQAVYRGYCDRKYAKQFRIERTMAAITIQRYVRRFLAIQESLMRLHCIIFIQRWYRNQKLAETQRHNFMRLRNCTVTIQKWYRKILLARKIERLIPIARQMREETQITFKSAIVIQKTFRGYLQMKQMRSEFLQLKQSTIVIQRRFRAVIEMRKQRAQYQKEMRSIVTIQRMYRANMQMKMERQSFLAMKSATVRIQDWYRACRLRNAQRNIYLKLKQCTVTIQRHFKAISLMRNERKQYLRTRQAAYTIQTQFRALKLMQQQRTSYLKLRTSTISIQTRYRALIAMQVQREKYLILKGSVIAMQRRYRANLLAKSVQSDYQAKKMATICIQQRFRAQKAMQKQRQHYLHLRQCVIVIQRKLRATIEMKNTRTEYQRLVVSTIAMQRRFRANRLAHKTQLSYQQLKIATVKIQHRFRANRATKQAKGEFDRLKSAAICLQRHFRAKRLMKMCTGEFVHLKWAAIVIQRRFRAQKAKNIQQLEYRMKRQAVIKIQQYFRGYVLMKHQRENYLKMKQATIDIQVRWRATLQMRDDRATFLLKRSSVIYIQQRFRDLILTRHQRVKYLMTRRSIVTIQRFFRGYLEMKRQRQQFLRLRAAAIVIQRQFIAHKKMLCARDQYQRILTSTIKIQTYFRSYVLMKCQREQFIKLHRATVCLQQRYRAQLLMRQQRIKYMEFQYYVICMQRRYRAKLLQKKIQAQYKLLRCLVICIQRKFRANIAMREERAQFLRLKSTACFIQQKYRAKLMARHEQQKFQHLKIVTFKLQTRIRGYLARQRLKALMTPEFIEKRRQNKAAKKIQAFWRGYRIRKTRSPMLRAICEKAKYLQKHAQHKNTVGQRVKGIVYFLKSRFNAKDAFSILRELEIISLTIPHTLIFDSTFIGNFCYGIMSQAIRSEVDKQIISLCCRVLLNLARYKPTQQNIFQIHHFETVAQILYRWCDKDCDIFNVLCTLLYVFIQCPTINQQMRDFMVTKEAIFLMREAKKLVARKERMRCITPPVWMPVLTSKEKRTLPMLETNFGVRTPKNYIFNCSVFGLDTILSRMNIIT